MCSNIKILKMFGLELTNLTDFHPLEVVARGSETQLQVGENLKSFDFALLGLTCRE